MSILNNSLLLGADAGAAGYQISRSIRLNASDSAFLSRTPASAGNRKTWTWSGWVKRSGLGAGHLFVGYVAGNDNQILEFRFSSDKLHVAVWTTQLRVTTQVFRDIGAWAHVVLAVDTTQAVANDRVKLYWNGVQITQFDTTNNPAQNADLGVNQAGLHTIGREWTSTSTLNGYLADIHFIDGQALTPSSFAETNATTGQWVPKAYSGSYGTNGFRLDFSNPFDLGNDAAGANDWTPNNLSGVSGGPTSVAAASGALPIYNTTDTYGATKGSGTRTDANSSSIVLAIPMDGANNGTTFTDESATIKGSGSAKTISRFGDTKTVTAQSKYYGSSGYFDGSGDYLALTANADFGFSSGTAFTIECWIYGSNLGSTPAIFGNREFTQSNSFTVYAVESSTNTLQVHVGGGTVTYFNVPGGLPNGRWHHIAMTRNTSNVVTFYVNGISAGTGSPAADLSNTNFYVGCWGSGRGAFFQGYIQDFRVYKDAVKYTSNFNPPSSTQNATVAAGNDSLVDTPTSYGTDTGAGGEVRGNYATLNPLASTITPSNGNLSVNVLYSAEVARGTIGINASKHYFEVLVETATTGHNIGITTTGSGNLSDYWLYHYNGNIYTPSTTITPGLGVLSQGTIIGVAVDGTAGTIAFYRNNVLAYTFTGLSPSAIYFPLLAGNSNGTYTTLHANFGQRAFAYTAPSGFKALCDTNLPAPTIARPSTVMDVVTYTGNDSTQTISSLGFSPDLVWIKCRVGTRSHVLFDQVRGTGAALKTNSTAAEASPNPDGIVSAFTSNGFTVTGGSSSDFETNNLNDPLVAWTWDAGSSTVTNTQGSITSTVRASASSGFSVVSYTVGNNTSQTIGHGLGVAPQFIIVKERNQSNNWFVYHASLGNTSYLNLNTTSAVSTGSNLWNSTSPTSTVFTIRSGGSAPTWDGRDHVAYCFAPVAGYSSFGSYTGNGSADGPFVYTGFRPRFVLFKRTDSVSSGDWVIYDTARDPYNVCQNYLLPNSSGAEAAFANVDYLSNGFKLKSTGSINTSGGTWIYAAFAESPFQFSRAR